MLPELLPELTNSILTLLSWKDIKNVSLCSKQYNHLVAPMLWKDVCVTSNRLLFSTCIPSNIAFTRHLHIDLYGITEVMNKLVALLKFSSPTTLTLYWKAELSIVMRCLAAISELTGLKNLTISGNNIISDAGLQHIGRLTDLVNLNISHNRNISDAGLQHLSHLTGLVNLDISACNISDDGLQHLRHLVNLKSLNISSNRISDAGLQHLRHLVNLNNLNISWCNISDAGFDYLRHLVDLKNLDIFWCKISGDGLDHLRRHLTDQGVAHAIYNK